MLLLEFFRETKDGKLSTTRLASFFISCGFMIDWMSHVFRAVEFSPDWAIVVLIATVLGVKELPKLIDK